MTAVNMTHVERAEPDYPHNGRFHDGYVPYNEPDDYEPPTPVHSPPASEPGQPEIPENEWEDEVEVGEGGGLDDALEDEWANYPTGEAPRGGERTRLVLPHWFAR